MFIKEYDPSAGEANVLEVHNDVFKNELIIKSVHNYGGGTIGGAYNYNRCVSIHREVPIDIVYISGTSGESFFLTWWGDYISHVMRLKIDGKYDMSIEQSYVILEPFDDGEWEAMRKCDSSLCDDEAERFYGERMTPSNRCYFELSKEQLRKLCSASSLLIQVSDHQNAVQFEGDATGFITILQALYKKVIDDTSFANAMDIAINYCNTNVKKYKKEDSRSTRIIISVIAATFLMMAIMAMSTCS